MEEALAPYLPLVPLAPVSEAPAPVNEEDDERETAGGKERLSAQSRYRPPVRIQIGSLPPAHHTRPLPASPNPITSPFDADPFRNGLGTSYRC